MLLGRIVTALGLGLMVHADENIVAERYGLDIDVDAPIDVVAEVILSMLVTFAGALLSVGGFQNARGTRGRMTSYDELVDMSDLLPPTSREVALARLRRLYGSNTDQKVGSGERFGEMGCFGPASKWGLANGDQKSLEDAVLADRVGGRGAGSSAGIRDALRLAQQADRATTTRAVTGTGIDDTGRAGSEAVGRSSGHDPEYESDDPASDDQDREEREAADADGRDDGRGGGSEAADPIYEIE